MINVEELQAKQTNGDNYDVSNADVIARLQDWDTKYGIETTDIEFDRVTIKFAKLPEDTAGLATEIYEFCPDTVDQGFGCLAEMLEMAEELGQEIDPAIKALMEGVDLDTDDYGLVLLGKSLIQDKTVSLWWD